jgi:hypothetical protein
MTKTFSLITAFDHTAGTGRLAKAARLEIWEHIMF